ncbi:MAG: hypothetical protein N2745_02250 [Syntrophorhabdaceae bacterium]|nr:hypothetical protein [Syntrophorhabdaceae bacterium]
MAPKIKNLELKEITLPLITTFATSLGKKDWIKSIIIKIDLDDGSSGIAECPTSFAFKEETPDRITSLLNNISCSVVDREIVFWEEMLKEIKTEHKNAHMTISSLEVAMFRAYLNSIKIEEHNFWGGKCLTLETDITIPFLKEREALNRWLEGVIKKGFKSFKIKLSGLLDEDRAFISYIDERLKEKIDVYTMRLDGNQGYDEHTFLLLSDALYKKGYAIDCVEQPLKKENREGLKKVKERCAFPIILDESILNYRDLEFAVTNNMCDGVNIKIAKSGIVESKKILDGANRYGLKKMIGCMTETMIGLSAGIYFAAGTGEFDFIDLDAVHFLKTPSDFGDIKIEGPVFYLRKNAQIYSNV